MHIPDGYLPAEVVIGGYVVTGIATWYSIKKINQRKDPRAEIPKASILTAAFIVVSLIHIPIPPTSVHLMLSGLMGILLGYYAFPAILIGVLFQSVLFHHGGITTIGINTINFGIPALITYQLFRPLLKKIGTNRKSVSLIGFSAGMIGAALSVIMFTLIIINFIPAELDIISEKNALITLSLAHIPIIIIEGIVSAIILTYLLKAKPKLLKEM